MADPIAFFLTWSTYGSRLHGDPRGSVDLTHNQRRSPTLRRNDTRAAFARARLASAPVLLDPNARALVDSAVRAHAAHRAWRVLALNVRSNHVHLVAHWGPQDRPTPERMLREFKSWSTRRLRREGGWSPTDRVWTDHGSTKWIDTEASLRAAIDYVERLQD